MEDQHGDLVPGNTLRACAVAILAAALSFQASAATSPDAPKPAATAGPTADQSAAAKKKKSHKKSEAPSPAASKPAPPPLPLKISEKPEPPAPPAGRKIYKRFADSPEGKNMGTIWPRDPAKTYELLAPLEPVYAGDVDYDYIYGSAALDSGHPSVAVFVLLRAVAVSPDFPGARLELARAYFAAGDNESARREFLVLQKEQPPPNVAQAIVQYLDAIDAKSISYKPKFGALLEAGGGYDSNANGATSSDVFGGFNLNDRSHSKSSPFYNAGASGWMSYPFVSHWRAVADAAVSQQNYPSATFVNTTLARLGGGFEWGGAGPFSFATGVSGTYAALDGKRNNTNVALDASGVYGFAPNWEAGVNARVSQLRFADDVKTESINSYLGGVALSHVFGLPQRLQVVGALTFGKEKALEDDSPFGRSLFGGRISSIFTIKRNADLSASIAYLRSNYDDAGTTAELSLGHRRDNQASVGVSFDLKDFPGKYWGIGTQITAIDNRSSIDLYQYRRVVAGVVLRREFR